MQFQNWKSQFKKTKFQKSNELIKEVIQKSDEIKFTEIKYLFIFQNNFAMTPG